MSPPLLHPTLDAVLAIHAELLALATHGGTPGLKSRPLLEAALAAPQASPPDTDPIAIAAAYLFHLARSSPFLHASPSVALATCLLFLSENHLLKNEGLNAPAWETLTLDTAASALSRDEVTQKLRNLVL